MFLQYRASDIMFAMSCLNYSSTFINRSYRDKGAINIVLTVFIFVTKVQGFCGDSIKWSHNFNIEDVYGMWYGVGYAQHTPDMTNKPNDVGCLTLFITDATTESHDDWLDWSIIKRNYSDQNWRSDKSNPWSGTSISGSWLDVRIKRKVKRDLYNERRIRVIWDEDGQSLEQTYLYTPEEPGLWVADKRRMLEREFRARGVDIWYPDDPPRHPQVIRILKVTPHQLTINHCSEIGGGGVFSLILRRSPTKMRWAEWYNIKKQFFNFELPNIYRYTTICSSCVQKCSLVIMLLCVAILRFL